MEGIANNARVTVAAATKIILDIIISTVKAHKEATFDCCKHVSRHLRRFVVHCGITVTAHSINESHFAPARRIKCTVTETTVMCNATGARRIHQSYFCFADYGESIGYLVHCHRKHLRPDAEASILPHPPTFSAFN
jgi:hypothetical protein